MNKTLVLVLFLIVTGCVSTRTPKRVASVELPLGWVEIGPNSKAIARWITRAEVCPMIQFDTRQWPMVKRSAPDAPVGSSEEEKFPVLVCESTVPAGTMKAQVEGHVLALPKKEPKRIIVIGDTGCRIKTGPLGIGGSVQDCNDPTKWPFETLAQNAAAMKPDLVVHLGDYFYRESPCPKGGCEGSPYGDRWETWSADFFKPGRTLLAAAPWVFVRGNHEDCRRGKEGWSRFLEPREYSNTCSETTDPYLIQIGPQPAIVYDSAIANDMNADPKEIAIHRKHFEKVHKLLAKWRSKAWMFTHKPFWLATGGRITADPGLSTKTQPVLSAAAASGTLGRFQKAVSLIFAGHVHAFQALQFEDKGTSQLIVGNGGTERDELSVPVNGRTKDGRMVESALVMNDFGFMVLDVLETRGDRKWEARIYNAKGEVSHRCTVNGHALNCLTAEDQ